MRAQIGERTFFLALKVDFDQGKTGEPFKCLMQHLLFMAELQMAWERQPDDRQWKQPEGDDPRTLYQMLMTSVERFGSNQCFGYIPEKGMPRTHLTYDEFGSLSTAVGQRLADLGVSTGDRVAMILDNSVEWAAISYGTNAIGAAFAP